MQKTRNPLPEDIPVQSVRLFNRQLLAAIDQQLYIVETDPAPRMATEVTE